MMASHSGEYAGLRVRISGIQSRVALNDAIGRAVSWDRKLGRYAIQLESGERVSLKPANVAVSTERVSLEIAAMAGLTLACSVDSSTSFWHFSDDDDDLSSGNAALGIRRHTTQGLGGFALRPIEPGERVLTELPLLAWSRQRDDDEIEAAVGRLGVEARRAFWALCQSVELGAERTVRCTWKSNALPMYDAVGTAAVYRLLSRLNHSCRPNAHAAWSETLQMVTLHALTPIARGEELTICYGGGGDGATREQRQAALLRTFGFACCCELCSLSADLAAESDKRQALIAELGRRILGIPPAAPPADCLALVSQRLELMAAEGMRTSWDTYGSAMHFLGRGRNFKAAAQWGAQAAMCAAAALGKDAVQVRSFSQALAGLEAEWVAAGKRLRAHGYAIVDGFTGTHAARDLAAQLTSLYREAGGTAEFRQGETGGGPEGVGDDIRNNDAIRGDRRALVDVTDPRVPGLHSAFFLVDEMLMVMARGAGVDELMGLTHRSRPQFTCYEGGARYVRHVDNADDNGRLITCILCARHLDETINDQTQRPPHTGQHDCILLPSPPASPILEHCALSDSPTLRAP